MGALIVFGVASGPINPLVMTIFQERTPAAMRGRVLGLMTTVTWVAMPLGHLLAGYLIEWLGLRFLLIAVAAAYVAVSLSILVVPAFHDMTSSGRPADGS